jgi:hypothetical protein
VFASITVDNVSEIDTAKQSFDLRLILELEWMVNEADMSLTKVELRDNGPTWVPGNPRLPNALTFEIRDPTYTMKSYDQMVMMNSTVVITGTFAESLEILNFPFDCQDLKVEMEWPLAIEEMKVSC